MTPKAGAAGERALDLLVDARGYRCPIPALRLRRALEPLREGDEIVLLSDDPLARIDVPHFAAAAGHHLIGADVRGDEVLFRIRKGRSGGGVQQPIDLPGG